jgi:hypothetical protein
VITKKLHLKVTRALIISCAFLLLGSSLAQADVCQIIRIEHAIGHGVSRIEIFPEKITVPVGTCTVWVNWIDVGEVQISFRENVKSCILAIESPSGFKEAELKTGETCYLSDSLRRGRSASLLWKKPGVYKYTLELTKSRVTTSPTRLTTGIIEVK